MPLKLRNLVLIAALFCSGCGFHLRDKEPLPAPLQHVYIQSQDPYGKLVRGLKQYFKVTGVQVASSEKTAEIVLDILSEKTDQQLLSVSNNQQTRQYNLILTVIFQLTTPKGLVLMQPSTLTETRSFTVESNQILGGSNQASTMYQEMRQAMIFDIIDRLSSQEVKELVTRKP